MSFPARALADIGVNYFGRDFEWAERVLAAHAADADSASSQSIVHDTTDWPAQILPYYFGAMELLRLREHARFELGERFDERRFHDAVLMAGELPLEVLRKHIDWFIEQEKQGGAPGTCE